jgi:t-SNARE complex subunit (syntaxin)
LIGGDQHSSGEPSAAIAEAWSRQADVLWIEKTTSEAVSSVFLNTLCPLTRNKTTRHLTHKVEEGQENLEEARVS